MRELYITDASLREKCRRALHADKPLCARIGYGAYKGSQGHIAAHYVKIDQWGNFVFTGKSFVMDFGKKQVRFSTDGLVANYMQVVTPGNAQRYTRKAQAKAPAYVLDRHGEKLVEGDAVLVARKESFTFGIIDKLTATATIVRNGKTKSRLVNSRRKMAGIVRLDKNLSARFMMEKLARA